MSVEIPTIDVEPFLVNPDSERAQRACELVRDSMDHLGLVTSRDPRLEGDLTAKTHEATLGYFRQPEAHMREDEIANHQAGFTGEFTERAEYNDKVRALMRLPPEHHPALEFDTPGKNGQPRLVKDRKYRFFRPIDADERPAHTAFPALYPDPIIPRRLPGLDSVMRRCRKRFVESGTTILQMYAQGCGADRHLFDCYLPGAPHLFAFTGSDLRKYPIPGTPFALVHDDLNLLTGHLRSNMPGLRAWTSQNERFMVRVPEGYMLWQSCMELEHLTGGRVKAGLHEVIRPDEVPPGVDFRVSVTGFLHALLDLEAEVLPPFRGQPLAGNYKPIKFGQHVLDTITAIGLTDVEV